MKKLSSYQKLKQKNAELEKELWTLKLAVHRDDVRVLAVVKGQVQMTLDLESITWKGKRGEEPNPNDMGGIFPMMKKESDIKFRIKPVPENPMFSIKPDPLSIPKPLAQQMMESSAPTSVSRYLTPESIVKAAADPLIPDHELTASALRIRKAIQKKQKKSWFSRLFKRKRK